MHREKIYQYHVSGNPLHSVYAIRCNAKPHALYIGSTNSIYQRWSQHKDAWETDQHANLSLATIARHSSCVQFIHLATCTDRLEAFDWEEFYVHLSQSYGYYTFNIEPVQLSKNRYLSRFHQECKQDNVSPFRLELEHLPYIRPITDILSIDSQVASSAYD